MIPEVAFFAENGFCKSPWRFVEDGVQSFAIESETEAMFFKIARSFLLYLSGLAANSVSISFADHTVLPSAELQFVLDSVGQRFHPVRVPRQRLRGLGI